MGVADSGRTESQLPIVNFDLLVQHFSGRAFNRDLPAVKTDFAHFDHHVPAIVADLARYPAALGLHRERFVADNMPVPKRACKNA